MIRSDEVRTLFYRKLKKNFKRVETSRKLVIRYLLAQIVSYFLVLAVICYWQFLTKINPDIFLAALMISIGLVCGFSAVHKAQKQTYQKNYKRYIVQPIAQCIDPNWCYKPFKGIQAKDFKASKLFPAGFDLYLSDDLISCTIGKSDFHCADVHIQ